MTAIKYLAPGKTFDFAVKFLAEGKVLFGYKVSRKHFDRISTSVGRDLAVKSLTVGND